MWLRVPTVLVALGAAAPDAQTKARTLRLLSGAFRSNVRDKMERFSSQAASAVDAALRAEAESDLGKQFAVVEQRVKKLQDELKSTYNLHLGSEGGDASSISLPTESELELRAAWWVYARAAARAGRDAAREEKHWRSMVAILNAFMDTAYLEDCRRRWVLQGKVLLGPRERRSWPKNLAEYFDDCVSDYVQIISWLVQLGSVADADQRLAELNSLNFLRYEAPERVHVQLPQIRAQTFWKLEDLGSTRFSAALRLLQAETDNIVQEVEALAFGEGAWRPVSGSLAGNGTWPSIKLHSGGSFNEEGCAMLPRTCTTLREHLATYLDRGLKEVRWPQDFERPYLSASVYGLSPGASLKLHVGQPGRLAVHLGLLVPPGQCFLQVGGERQYHARGELMLFDDAFLHLAVNRDTTTPRVVLGFFLWHPDALAQAQDDIVDTEL